MNAPDALARRMAQTLHQALAPTALEVLDESWRHAGHAGANGSGYGTHFLVRLAAPAFAGKSRLTRSEERRVGKECRSRWSPYH